MAPASENGKQIVEKQKKRAHLTPPPTHQPNEISLMLDTFFFFCDKDTREGKGQLFSFVLDCACISLA